MNKVINNGLVLEQRIDDNPIKCFTFVMKAKEAIEFCTVIRQTDSVAEGYQRRVNFNKLKAIKKFMTINKNNIIPNNVIIAIGKELSPKISNNTLTFEYDEKDKKALIIDGQHRLYGLNEYSEDAKVLITALIDIDIIDQAFQFVVINNKSQSAKVIDVKAVINADAFKDKLQDRFIEVGIRYGNTSTILDYFNKNDESPFKNLIDWDLNSKESNRIIQIKALEDIFKLTKNNIPLFNEEDDSTILNFINIIWTLIRDKFRKEWDLSINTKNKDSNLLKKSTIVALTEFIILESKSAQRYSGFSFLDFSETTIKEKVLEHTIFKIPNEFFTADWKVGLDTSGGKDLIKESLDMIIDNIENNKHWDERIPVLKKSE